MANTALTSQSSSLPDYKRLLEEIGKKIEASKEKLHLHAESDHSDEQVPVQTPAVPDYEALRNGLVERWKDFAENNSLGATIEMLCYADVLLARLAVLTEYMRIKESEDDETNGVKKLDKARMQLPAYDDGVVRLERVLQTSRRTLKDVQPFHAWDARLSDIAMDTVSRERFEHQLAEYQSRVKDEDYQGWQTVYEMRIKLQKRLMAEAGRTAQVVSLVIYLVLDSGAFYAGNRSWTTASQKRYSEVQKRYMKIAMAVFGGMTLLVPMLIMVLHPGIITVLVTTSVSVLTVAVTLAAIVKEADAKDIVLATLAYAAVLVVFVGASGPSSGTSASDGSTQGSRLSNGKVGGIVVGSIFGTLMLLWTAVGLWFAYSLGEVGLDQDPLQMTIERIDQWRLHDMKVKQKWEEEKGTAQKAPLPPLVARRRVRDFDVDDAERGEGAREVVIEEPTTHAQPREGHDDEDFQGARAESV
ncbi:hypothetical protein LTR91_004394 [Friedmanniomyces endolithicus]|uniref:Uncharacterized protein n=1 Tax=Friedmanniomyces endolithicus TaxID=329885 RepID=A0AAN6KW56_9PEZI|nr:hypothetical protein LTR57_007599 [Friedmanniomyces endolithicus]KAK0971381.1 hypothetical protein LTS01_015338 [Friedmanniomyces endolithicus]KAK1004316.1 hypothetical protein LTR91_004394 [Friedmanniomyces endolithicus]KAK1038792.1 hypothetical protein LTS16_011787 [Friedmanniomyces endolithicus]KAK1078653.1 hypothetical protein LTR33_007051 [Friedmanniomyces endolithicus]